MAYSGCTFTLLIPFVTREKGGFVMGTADERRRKVVVCTNTEDGASIRGLCDALEVERGCTVIVTDTEELREHCGKSEGADAVLLDDVNPAECPDAKKLVRMLLSLRPPIMSIVILVGEEDWDHVSEVVAGIAGAEGRIAIHCHSDSLDKYLDFLAGKLQFEEMVAD
jgi:hypothetical protein